MNSITRPEDQSTQIRSLTSPAGQLNDEAWEGLLANTAARMIANGQLDPDTCAEVDKPFEEWLDSLPEDCYSTLSRAFHDPIDSTYSDAADFPIDDDDVPFEDSKPYFHRQLPDGSIGVSIERLYSRLHLKSEIQFIEYTATPPQPVKKALDNGATQYRWGNSFIYCAPRKR